MDYIILSIDKIKLNCIKLCNLYSSIIKKKLEINYKDTNKIQKIYLSSPELFLPWNIVYSDDEKNFTIELAEYTKLINIEQSFLFKLDKLIDHILKAFVTHKLIDTINKKRINLIKDVRNSKSIKFYNIRIDDISIFNEYQQNIEITEIKQNDSIKALFVLNYCWTTENSYGIDIKLIQLMRLKCKFSEKKCLIEHNNFVPPIPPIPPIIPQKMRSNNNFQKNSIQKISYTPSVKDLQYAIIKLKKTSEN